ncbi:MAG TPA: transketolase [Drouetiella sp.]
MINNLQMQNITTTKSTKYRAPANPTLTGLQLRKAIIEQSKRAGVGHIGSALSVADIVACLYGKAINAKSPRDPKRDRFVLSKGHAALALYAAFFERGWITEEQLNTYCGDGSDLGVHPEHALPGVDFATGSLGQGLSFGTGAALAAKRQKSDRRVFVLLSDAECNEGSVWEAIMFAAQHKLNNLFAILDLNGQQAFGYTKDVLNLSPMDERWKAFGWDVHNVDGHDEQAMADIIENNSGVGDKPHVLIAHTTFGKGVSYMEHQIKWHYSPLNDAEYKQAMSELESQS